MYERLVGPDEKAVNGIFHLRGDFAANEKHHQDGDQRHTEKRGEEHGKGLGESERLEKPSFLRGE